MSSISFVRRGRSLSVTLSRPYKTKSRNAELSTTLIAYFEKKISSRYFGK
jgi:hypothetical protein